MLQSHVLTIVALPYLPQARASCVRVWMRTCARLRSSTLSLGGVAWQQQRADWQTNGISRSLRCPRGPCSAGRLGLKFGLCKSRCSSLSSHRRTFKAPHFAHPLCSPVAIESMHNPFDDSACVANEAAAEDKYEIACTPIHVGNSNRYP